MVNDYSGRSTQLPTGTKFNPVNTKKASRVDLLASQLTEKANKNSVQALPPRVNGTPPKSTKPGPQAKAKKDEKPSTPMRTRSKNFEEATLTPAEQATLGASSSLLGAVTQQPQCMVCKRGFRKGSASANNLQQCLECKRMAHPGCDAKLSADQICPDCRPEEPRSDSGILDGSMEAEYEAKPSPSNVVPDVVMAVDLEEEPTKRSVTSPSKNPILPAPSDSIAANVQQRKRQRKPRQTTSPQPYSRRSASAASEDRQSPAAALKNPRTSLLSGPSTSQALQGLIGVDFDDFNSDSEPSGSPDSFLGSNARSRANDDQDEYKPSKSRTRRTDSTVSTAARSKGKQKSKPAQQKPSMRTRSGGKPASCITPHGMIAPDKNHRGRKNCKGKSARGRRANPAAVLQKPQRPVVEVTRPLEERQRTSSKVRSHDDVDYIRTAIVSCRENRFLDSTCLCLVCGSVGKDSEATMITCTSCAQSYHTYCVNMHEKLNNTVLKRGWRCLDCTVCEGCGTDKDESRLLLCEECDISFHTYCLDPPLKEIPNGPWRCKWCATCCRCNKQVQSGLDLSKLEGLCETCYSLRKCPKCCRLYEPGDLLIKCHHCERWYHGPCEGHSTEDEVENASENAFRCSLCRPKLNTYHEQYTFIDNVTVTRSGLETFPKLGRTNSSLSFHEGAFRSSMDQEEYEGDDIPNEMTYFSTGPRGGRGRGSGAGRRVTRIGVGGFIVRIPRHRLLAELTNQGKELQNELVEGEGDKKQRKPRKPRRPRLEEAYPPHIQEAFFGIDPVDSRTILEIPVEEPVLGEHHNFNLEDKVSKLGTELPGQAAAALREAEESDLLGLLDLGGTDIDDGFDFNLGDGLDFNDQLGLADESLDMQDNDFDDIETTTDRQQFLAQMEESHERQRQLQEQQRQGQSAMNPLPQAALKGMPSAAGQPHAQEKNNCNAATESWEKDEPLGDKATKAAVLYSNMIHPELKEKFPQWSERVKQINKIWRQLDADKRSEYVNKARENRTNMPRGRPRRDAGQKLSVDDQDTSRDSFKMESGTPTEESQPHPNQMPPPTPTLQPNGTPTTPLFPQHQVNPQIPPQMNQMKQQQIHPQMAQTPQPQMMRPPQQTGMPMRPPPPQYLNGHSQEQGQPPVNQMQGQMNQIPGQGQPIPGQIPSQMHFQQAQNVHQQQPGLLHQPQPMHPQQQQHPQAQVHPGMHPPQPHPAHQQMVQPPIAHLLSKLSRIKLDEYVMMRKTLYGVEQEQRQVEEELNKYRKIKKNMNAKRRNVRKNYQAAQENRSDQALPPEDLPPDEIEKLERVINDVTCTQKKNEACKQRFKELTSKITSFEQSHGLPEHKNVPLDALLHAQAHPELVQQQMSNQMQGQMPAPYGYMNQGMEQGQQLQSPNFPIYMENQNTMLRQPTQPYPNQAFFNGHPAPVGYPNGVRVPAYSQQVARQLVSPDVGGSSPTTPASGRPGSSASIDPTPKTGRGRKRKRVMLPTDETRTPIMGGHIYSRLSNDVDRDVYDSLDLMVNWVTLAVESGTETLMRKLPTLKVSEPFDEHFNPYQAIEPPKAKKKRQIAKKPSNNEASEYDLFVGKLESQLKGCIIENLQYEQSPDSGDRHFSDDTQLLWRNGVTYFDGNEIGEYHPNFMPDYYSVVEKFESFDPTPIYPRPMNQIYCDVDVSDLATAECNVTNTENQSIKQESMEVDESEGEKEQKDEQDEPEKTVNMDLYHLKWRNIGSDEIGESTILPLLHRVPERTVPVEPHKSAIKHIVSGDPDEKFKVELMGNLDLREETINELKQILGQPSEITIKEIVQTQNTVVVKKEPVEVNNEPKCRYCQSTIKQYRVRDFILQRGVTFGITEPEVRSLCSMKCYFSNAADSKRALHQEIIRISAEYVDELTVVRLKDNLRQHVLRENQRLQQAKEAAAAGPQQLISPIPEEILADFPFFFQNNIHSKNELVMKVSDLPQIGSLKQEERPKGEFKWRKTFWMIYDGSILQSFERPHNEKFAAFQHQLNGRVASRDDDDRVCSFCGHRGDGEQHQGGRLLNVDANEWVHVNCAMWSSEVFETADGALMNVETALRRAETVNCKVCHRLGASLRCYKLDCPHREIGYHLLCAKKAGGKFGKDKNFYCPAHDIRPEACVSRWDNLRRIYIERPENQLLSKIFNNTYSTEMMMRVGNLIFTQLGQLLPEQLKNFHTEEFIFPVGYNVIRLFWSPLNVNELARYECTIREDEGRPLFKINFLDKELTDRSMNGVWSRILMAVQQLREKTRAQGSEILRFYPALMNCSMLYGLNEPAVTKMTESLPGVDQMFDYSFRHGGLPLMDLPLALNPSGCARCEPHCRTLVKPRFRSLTQSPLKVEKIKKDAFNAEIISRESRRSRTQRNIHLLGMDENYIKMMRKSGITEEMLIAAHVRYDSNNIHNAHSQYKKMKSEWRNFVYLARSKIQGLGLYAKRDIDMNTMIIEYVGEVIRSEVCEAREKKYLAQNRGTYMFRIDDDWVIDATMSGSLARYVNHSCDPNCFTKRMKYNDEEKIVIVSNRPIKAGEELTYDYMFELEDDQTKVPCLCGAPNCNKWMN
uniref:Histone-lysine N-methyltransferase n=1 Tax=Bursaphelenchus xylophilus TaxID=6326 RepID=A0A1I7RZ32_BURXY